MKESNNYILSNELSVFICVKQIVDNGHKKRYKCQKIKVSRVRGIFPLYRFPPIGIVCADP